MKRHPRLIRIWTFCLLALACNLSSPDASPQIEPASPAPATQAPSPVSTSPPSIPTAAPPEADADIIFFNGRIRTMAADQPSAEALAVAGGLVTAVGPDDDVLALAGPRTRLIDLAGRTMLPGFIDSHTHRLSQRWKWGYDSIAEAARAAAAEGWTTLNELAVDPGFLGELQAAAEAGALPLRVNAYLMANSFEGESLGDWYRAYQPGEELAPNLRVAGLKIFIDFDSGRSLLFTQDELNDFLAARQAEGWQQAMKAISIQSHELALQAISFAQQDAPGDDLRYRIEHALAVTDEQLASMAALGVVASIQPGFPGVIWYAPDTAAMVAENGLANIFRWPDYLAAGLALAASPYNPDGANAELTGPSHVSALGLLYRGATQIGLGGSAPEPWMLEKALSVEQILPLITIQGAYASFQENERGSLEPGKQADLVVLSADPLDVPPEGLLGIEVLLTMVGGQMVHCAEGAEALCAVGENPAGLLTVPAGSPVWIAAVGPAGGEFAAFFQQLLAAFEMAIADFGPVHGFSAALHTFYAACGEIGYSADPGPILADPRIAAVLGPLCSTSSVALLPALEAARIAIVSPSATRVDLTTFAPEMFNRTPLNDGQLAAAGLDLAHIESLESVQAFYADFQARTGLALPPGDLRPYLAYGYDAAQVLLDALARSAAIRPDGALAIDREALASALRTADPFFGITGPVLFDSAGNRVP